MIRYHGGPITPNSAALEAWTRGHAMISFAHQQQCDLAFSVAQSVVLDNGAFSWWKAGNGSIDIPAYKAFVDRWRNHPAFGWCVIPDEIEGSEAINRRLVDEWPLERAISVPVWHMHETLEFLTWLTSNFPRIAIGSSGEFSRPGSKRWWNRMAEAMKVVCDGNGFPVVKLHGLRQMDPEIFSVVPYSSVDSCGLARNIGLDCKWNGSYAPEAADTRALVYRRRMDEHASSKRWPSGSLIQRNLELLG